MFNGLNKGISYKRTSQADPYELANHKEQLERETAAQKAGSTGTASSGFGLTPIDFTSGDAIKATKNLDLRQNKEGFFETPQLDIEYKGEKLHFNSKLDAYRWSYDGENIAKLKNQLDDVNEQLSKTRKLTADLGFGERMSLEKEKAHLEYQIRKLDMVHERRSKVLKKHGYYMSDSEYRDVAKAYGFDEDDFDFSIDDIYEATNGSMTNVVSGRVNAIHVAPPSGTSAGADDKVTYMDDKITKKIKGRVSNGLVANNPGEERLDLYEISPNGLRATGLKRKNNKTKDLKKIIERATSIYTTIELLTGFDGTNAQNYDPKSAIPIIVFQDPEGRRVGVPIDYLGYEYRGVFNKALGYIANSGGVLTNRNRGQIERYIAKDMADVSNMIYGKD